MADMVKAYVWIRTNKIGSQCVTKIEVEAEDAADEEALIEVGKDVIWVLAEWGVSLTPPEGWD